MKYAKYDAELDQQQYDAVTAPVNQPTLILAGAGSGKTRVMQMRTVFLVNQGIPPEEIIATTFTKKAATELKDRIASVLDRSTVSKIMFGTIHSVCYRMLQDAGMDINVIEERDKRIAIEECCKANSIKLGWKYLMYWINRSKAEMISSKESEEFIYNKLSIDCGLDAWSSKRFANQISTVHKYYEKYKSEAGLIDYGDMIFLVARRLKNDDEWCKMWQDRVSAVLIDEAQDDMKLAVDILETLAAPENRITICADDMQELYGWNMADVDHNVFGFLDRYPNAKLYKIETNYRSTQKIVTASNKLVECHYGLDRQKFKKIIKHAPSALAGQNISIVEADDQIKEADIVAKWIKDGIDAGKKPNDFYVIYRLNAQSRPIEDKLLQYEIPYTLLNGKSFYDRESVLDMIAYLYLTIDKTENANKAFRRIANIASVHNDKYYRGFGIKFFEQCSQFDSSLWEGMLKLYDKGKPNFFIKKGIDDFVFLMNCLQTRDGIKNTPSNVITNARNFAYNRWLFEREGMEDTGDTGITDDLDELSSIVSKFDTIEEFLNYVIRIREAMKAQKAKGELNSVTLSTVHRVKGLEKPCVAFIGLSDGVLPHYKALQTQEERAINELPIDLVTKIEDERCICFVGVTRAKEELLITYPKVFRNEPVQRSRFLTEMFGKEQE